MDDGSYEYEPDAVIHRDKLLPLYWLADDWGGWSTENALASELKWAVLWNDIVFIPDDFMLTNRHLRHLFDPDHPSGESVARLLVDGALRVVVRDAHSGYQGRIESIGDAAKAIMDDHTFVWPGEQPSGDYVHRLDELTRRFTARPRGIDVDDRFRAKLQTVGSVHSVAHRYYKELLVIEAQGNGYPRSAVDAGSDAIRALAVSPRIRRSLVYRLTDPSGGSATPEVSSDVRTVLRMFPKTLRALADDVFLHNLMENFLPIARFPLARPAPVWLDTADRVPGTQQGVPHTLLEKQLLLPTFTGMVIARVGELSFSQVEVLRKSAAGRDYRRALTETLAAGGIPSADMSDALLGSCSGYISDIARDLGIPAAGMPNDNFALRWSLHSCAAVVSRASFSLVIAALRPLSVVTRLFSLTLADAIADQATHLTRKRILKDELSMIIGSRSPKSHRHIVTPSLNSVEGGP